MRPPRIEGDVSEQTKNLKEEGKRSVKDVEDWVKIP
jgi:hypothetical protein